MKTDKIFASVSAVVFTLAFLAFLFMVYLISDAFWNVISVLANL